MVTRLLLLSAIALGACDRTPEPPPSDQGLQDPVNSGGARETEASPAGESSADEPSLPQNEGCLVPLPESLPPAASSLEDCPDDPNGRPVMPRGTVAFPEAEQAPTLNVELALNDAHRTHGLMYRPSLEDDQGMLFSWQEDDTRSFWMRNTCLALDMLFIGKKGVIRGAIEQVPPMNDVSRSIECPVAHVLEVPAGWVRRYGVEPGQRVTIERD